MVNRRVFMAGLGAGLAMTAYPSVAQKIAIPAFKIEPLIVGLRNPWGMCAVPSGGMFVTERGGRLRYIDEQWQLSTPLFGIPKVKHENQGGLLDVQCGPNFAYNGETYISFALPDGNQARLAIARLMWNGKGFERADIIFIANPPLHGGLHFGSRLRFLADKTLIFTSGERYYADLAQSLDNHVGKILRIKDNGDAPSDNPFIGQGNAKPEIYSYGHRNPQGLAIHPKTNDIWSTEHGAKGGDELNLISAGKNYGWPIITHGVDYSGEKIGIGTHKEGMIQPKLYWTPSIAPSGAVFYQGQAFAELENHLLVGALKYRQLRAISIDDNNNVTQQEIMFQGDLGRIRDVFVGNDGLIYILNDEYNGGLFRLVPNR